MQNLKSVDYIIKKLTYTQILSRIPLSAIGGKWRETCLFGRSWQPLLDNAIMYSAHARAVSGSIRIVLPCKIAKRESVLAATRVTSRTNSFAE